MRILSIESSCDETSVALVEKVNTEIHVLSNVTATSLAIHSKTGGIIPEIAAREQVKFIMPVIVEALLKARSIIKGGEQRGAPIEHPQGAFATEDCRMGEERRQDPKRFKTAGKILKKEIDAIAVTYGPGLIGSLLVGVETAKALSYVFDKPLIPVNHLLAHIYANFISPTRPRFANNSQFSIPQFPFIGLIVSGGHTDLLLFKQHGKYEWIGGTRDDAAGEAFDKIGRVLGLTYPAGPEIERRANKVKKTDIKFKSPLINEDNFDFSFSGLKTEAIRFIQKNKTLSDRMVNEICYATQKAIIDVLVNKTLRAAGKYNCKNILVGGGVSANSSLKEALKVKKKNNEQNINIFFPEKKYSTDNGAMIGSYALLNPNITNWKKVSANPELYFA